MARLTMVGVVAGLLATAIAPLGCSDDDGEGPGPDAAAEPDSGATDAGVGSDGAAIDAGSDAGPGTDGAVDPDAAAPLWTPATATSWAIQYADPPVDTSIDVEAYDLDLFDTPQGTIDGLHGNGRRVICYFSAGSYEDWRPDAAQFPGDALGNPLDGWPGEWWLDVRHAGLQPVMEARLDLAVSKQCDAVDPDNVDGYANDTGFALTYQDQLDYLTWLAAEAHVRGLAIGLKNDLDQIGDLEPLFEFAVNEECLAWSECGMLQPFVASGKPVFHIEYVDDPADGPAQQTAVCGQASIQGFSTLIKTWDLDAWYLACP